jgi:glycerophosphoryl diester phosphodiesterase
LTRLGESGLGRRLAFAAAGWLPGSCPKASRRPPLAVVGHRGAARERPENTLPSFDRALEVGANAIETDVCVTRDGRFVLWHDADPDAPVALARQAGGERLAFRPSVPDFGSPWRRPVRELDLDDFRPRCGYVPAGGGESRVPIEPLERLFEWAPGARRLERVLLDVKLGEAETGAAAALLRAVRTAAGEPRLRSLVFHLLSPQEEIVRALSAEAARGGLPANVRICADFELPGVLRANRPALVPEVSMGCGERMWAGFRREVCRVVRARNDGRLDRVTVWTVNRERRLRQLLRIGVDAILTDEAAVLRRIADSLR